MSYRYPLLPRLLVEARAYAEEARQHTVTYEGWSPKNYMERATLGKYAQLWLAEFCRLNGISHKADRSSPYCADQQDLYIYDLSVDSKASNSLDIWPQVSINCNSNPVDAYVFFHLAKNMESIQCIGGCSHRQFLHWRVLVEKGEEIPGSSGLAQKYGGGSYFVKPSTLLPFDLWLQEMKNKSDLREAAA